MAELQDIKNKAIGYLARCEHSRHELKHKLLQKFPKMELKIEQVLGELADKNLQSDRRFLESFIRHRAQSGYGLLRIKQELTQHHIDNDLLAEVLESLEIDWLEVLQYLYQKRYSRKPVTDYADKMKRSQYLYSHGFSHDEIKELWQNRD
ncbi:MAG: regulatory protein RecX [Gammaproteobacteria bacterium]|nr:regulatory protein RecX [Gammaproteobacteria bacterium]